MGVAISYDADNSPNPRGNVILAIIDTGLAYNHPDLTQNIWRGWTPQ